MFLAIASTLVPYDFDVDSHPQPRPIHIAASILDLISSLACIAIGLFGYYNKIPLSNKVEGAFFGVGGYLILIHVLRIIMYLGKSLLRECRALTSNDRGRLLLPN